MPSSNRVVFIFVLVILLAQIAQNVEDTLVRTFVGPADVGTYSKSVQETLYNMGQNVLEAEPSITAVSSKLF
jgi:urate oxidase